MKSSRKPTRIVFVGSAKEIPALGAERLEDGSVLRFSVVARIDRLADKPLADGGYVRRYAVRPLDYVVLGTLDDGEAESPHAAASRTG